MADKEIADLTAAGTLDGSELVHVSQDGDSRKATLTDIVALSTGAMLKATYDPNDDGIIAVAQGGTNAATASAARTNLGLGTIAVQAASSVAITGGSVTGITDLAVADGGTGGSDASTARTNLGLAIGTDVQAYSANLAGFASTTVTNVQNRVNHTGTQLAATISDFSTASDLRIAAAVDVTVQAYSANLDDWSAIDTADKLDASVIPAAEDGKILSWTGTSLVNKTAGELGTFVVGEDVQAYSANLDDWSALATSAKQDASTNLTTLSDTTVAATVTALKALDTDDSSKVALTEEGKTGDWNLLTGDYSANVTGDPGGAWWLKADDSLTSAKAWRRARDFSEGAPIEFFGATGGDATLDTQAVEDAMLWMADDSDKNLGADIILGPHTYRIGETQRIRAPGTIRGQGGAFMNQFSSSNLITNGTVLKLESGVNADMFQCWLDPSLFSLIQDYRGFMRFENLLLHGNRSANANHPATDLNNLGSGIVAKGTRYVLLDNVTSMMFGENGISSASYDYGPDLFSKIFLPAQINTTNDTIGISGLVASDIPTGTEVRITTTGTFPFPLVAATTYYVIENSASSIKLAASSADATAGTAINLSGIGTGTHTINRYLNIGTNNIEVRNSRFMNNALRGMDLSVGDGTIVSNSVGYNGSDGIRATGIAVTALNWVWNNFGHGLQLTGNADSLISGNKSYDNVKSGFVIASDMPGGHIVGNMALRNNAVSTTPPIDSSGFYISTDSTNISIVGNMSHNLYSSNVKNQLYGFYFADADCVAQFDGNNAMGNLTENIRLAASTNIQWHADTSTSRGTHPGFKATGSIDANANQLMSVAALTGSAWAAKTITSNDLNVAGSRHCLVTPAGAETVNTITTNVTGLMEVFVRNGSTSNSITVTHNNAAIRCPNGANATIGPLEMAHFIHVSGAVWQMLGT